MKRVVTGILFLIVATGAAWAITEELESYRGVRPVLVVYSRATDEPRAFEFNLNLSTNWREVEENNLAIIDVIPGVYDVDVVANVLGIEGYDFAVLLFDLDGERVFITDRPDSLREILDTVRDLER